MTIICQKETQITRKSSAIQMEVDQAKGEEKIHKPEQNKA